MLSDLEKRLQLCKVEAGVETRGLVPDGALLWRLDLVPMQLLQFAPLAGCGPHLHVSNQYCSKHLNIHIFAEVAFVALVCLYAGASAGSYVMLRYIIARNVGGDWS